MKQAKRFIAAALLFSMGMSAQKTPKKQLYLMCDIALEAETLNHDDVPRNYRALPELSASGSAQCSLKQFEYVKSQVPDKEIIVLDTREETHGFINSLPVSWYMLRNQANKNKNPEMLLNLERKTFKMLKGQTQEIYDLSVASQIKKNIDKSLFKKHTWEVVTAQTEEEVAAQLAMNYARIHITDHLAPGDTAIELLFELFDRIKKEDLWLHVHCRAGKGRTTSILTAWDFYLNSHNTSLDVIIKRQHDAGGINLADARSDYTVRYEFMKKLYAYTQARYENKKLSWTEWKRQQEQMLANLAEVPPAA